MMMDVRFDNEEAAKLCREIQQKTRELDVLMMKLHAALALEVAQGDKALPPEGGEGGNCEKHTDHA